MANEDVQQIPIPDAMRMALEHHQAGRLPQAELIYRAILDSEPAYAGASHNLGLIALQRGRTQEAVPMLKAALDADPSQAAHWMNYAVALAGNGDPAAARAVLLRARSRGLGGTALAPMLKKIEQMIAAAQRPAAGEISAADLSALMQLYRQRRFADLETLGARLSSQHPNSARIWQWLGAGRLDQGRFEAARGALALAQERLPQDAVILNLLGLAYRRLGRNENANSVLEQALSLAPDNFDLLLNASANAVTLRDATAARRHAERALALQPENVDALRVLADAVAVGDDYFGAEALYRRAIALQPDAVDLYANLGDALTSTGRAADAVRELQSALDLQPDHVATRLSLGRALYQLGEVRAAVEHLRRASDLAPEMTNAHTAYLFCLSHDDSVSPQECFAEHVRIGNLIEARCRDARRPCENDRDPERALRIGFVSGDLRDHAVAYLIEPVWRAMRAGRHTIHAYSNYATEDHVSARLRALTDSWVRVDRLDDEALCERIRADRIDVLFDLSGHTVLNRLTAFARKPAPIQVSWIGYPATTGLSTIDYRFTRGMGAAVGQIEALFCEKLVRFRSRGFQPSPNAPAVNALPALTRGQVTFASFNRASKLNEGVIALWSRVLQALPDARLLIAAIDEARTQDRLRAAFAAHGIAADRLDLRMRVPMPQYLALHHEVDIALDTFPYSGGTTTSHAVWMGVPVLTRSGLHMQQNLSAASLKLLGLSDWIADSDDGFVARACEAVADLPALAALRQGLRERAASVFLGSTAATARELDTAFRIMWRRWCAGEPAESISL